jgi:hypothetical protein
MAVFQDWEFNCILAGQLRSVSETSALIVQISDLGGAIAQGLILTKPSLRIQSPIPKKFNHLAPLRAICL